MCEILQKFDNKILMFEKLILRGEVKYMNIRKKIVISLILIIFVIIIVLIYNYYNNQIKKTDSIDIKIEKTINKKIKTIETDGFLVIEISETERATNNFLTKIFPSDSAKILNLLKDDVYHNIIIRSVGPFLDLKGNATNDIQAAVYYPKDTFSEINYENWLTQIKDEPTVFYELASAYNINEILFNKLPSETINRSNKNLSDAVWKKYSQGIDIY